MRNARLVLAAVAATAAFPAGGAGAAGASLGVTPKITKTTVEVYTYGKATGMLTYPYTVTYVVTGVLHGAGYRTKVDDRWTVVVAGPGAVKDKREYPILADTDVTLAFAATVQAVSGAPFYHCEGVTTRPAGGSPSTTSTC